MTSTARTEVGIGAYGIEVRYQAADLDAAGAVSSTNPGMSRTSAASSSRTDAAGPAGEGSTVPSASLGPGAAAGIGVGVTVLVASLVGLGIWAWWRKRESRNHNVADNGPRHVPVSPEMTPQVHEVGDPKQAPLYFSNTPLHGPDTGPRTYELPNTHGRAEVS